MQVLVFVYHSFFAKRKLPRIHLYWSVHMCLYSFCTMNTKSLYCNEHTSLKVITK